MRCVQEMKSNSLDWLENEKIEDDTTITLSFSTLRYEDASLVW